MAVEIELELDASSALGQIGAVSLALENLDKKFDDLADFSLDLGEVGDEIRDLVSALDEVDVNLNSIADRIENAAEQLDGAEVSVATPDGETNAGNSSGNDPPTNVTIGSGFEDAARAISDGGESQDSFSPHEFKNNLSDLYGFDQRDITVAQRLSQDKLDSIASDLYQTVNDTGAKNLGGAAVPNSLHDMDLSDSIIVDTPKGKMGLGQAVREKQAGFPDWGDSGGSLGDGKNESFFGRGASKFSGNIDEAMQTASESMGSITKRLRKLKPSMGKYMQLMAALVPMMIAFGTQAAGVAAALGSVAGAGAAVMGLGLLGHANSMAGAFRQAKMEVRDFKKDLFNTFQPTMQQFAPIQSKFFDWAPAQLERVAELMEGLTQYEGTFYDIFNIGVGAIEELVNVLVQNQAMISEMATSAANLIATGLVDFFRWLMQTAYQNWQLMSQLGQVFMDFVSIAYNVSMIVARIVAALEPMFALIAGITQFLNNPLIVGILTAVTTFGILVGTVWKVTAALYAALGALSSFGAGSFISGIVGGISYLVGQMWGLITTMWSAIFTSQVLIATLSALTLGAFAVGAGVAGMAAMSSMQSGGGPGGSGYGGYGGGGKTVVYNDNRQYSFENTGDMSDPQEERMKDTIKEHNGTVSEMNPPSPGTNSDSSTTGSGNGGDGGGTGSN